MNSRYSEMLVLLSALSLCACTEQSFQFQTQTQTTKTDGSTHTEHFVSSNMQGNPTRIDLQQVQKAFDEAKAADFNVWMSTFETRVNQLYKGKEPLSYDASNTDGSVTVIGYISKSNQTTFQPTDVLVFKIQRTERNTTPPDSQPAQVQSMEPKNGHGHSSMFGDALRRGWGGQK